MKEQIKKVVLAALVAAFGFAAQAERLMWYVDFGSTKASEDNQTAYFFLSSDTKNVFSTMKSTTIADVIATYNNGGSFDSDSYIKAGTYVWDYTSDTNNRIYTYKQDITANDGYIEASFFAFIVDMTSGKYMIAKTANGAELTTAYYDTDETYKWRWDSATLDWVDKGNVPEPTSGLLLVLGMATLALKRRRV